MTHCEIYVNHHRKGTCYLPTIPREGETIMFNGDCDDCIIVKQIIWCINNKDTGATVMIYGDKTK